jgi:hypothetical protein
LELRFNPAFAMRSIQQLPRPRAGTRLADGTGVIVERFELVAWASSPEQLIDKLAQ